jgi:hypothetical protein
VQQKFDDEGRVLDPAVEESVRSLATNILDYMDRHVCPLITLEAMVREALPA